MRALPGSISMVKERLAPNVAVRFHVIKLLSLAGAVEVDAVALLVVAVAEGDEVWLVLDGHREGHVLGSFQDLTQKSWIGYLLIQPPQVVFLHDPFFYVLDIK